RRRHQRAERQARRVRDQLVHRRPQRGALRLQLQLGHRRPLLRADLAEPDRARLRRRDHHGLRRDRRRPDLGRGAVPVRAREVARHLGELRAAVRGTGADRHADPEPRRRGRRDLPEDPGAAQAAHQPGGGGREDMTDRILTTHTGSLIRPRDLLEVAEYGDPAAYERALAGAVADVVRRQAEAGIDVVDDGEMGKESWITYLYGRLRGT